MGGTRTVEIFIPEHFAVVPADRDNVQIAIAIEVYRKCTIVVFIAGVNHPLAPAAAAAIEIFKHQETGRARILKIVFPHHYIKVTVAIDVHDV